MGPLVQRRVVAEAVVDDRILGDADIEDAVGKLLQPE